MLKAAHSQSGEEFLIVSQHWRQQLDILRRLDRQGFLVCPGCRQPVRVKAGRVRRWHFAHKHLVNCPFERQSALLLETRAALYEWLVVQFGESAVTLEKIVSGLPRPLDCSVALPGDSGAAAYWIFDARMPPDERARLVDALSGLQASIVWLFAASLLRTEPGQPTQVHLTTTERAFKRQTDSDAANPLEAFTAGETLHYLDAESSTLISYHNLNLFHPPQLFAGRRLCTPLIDVYADPQNGDFLHPGEAVRISHYRQTRRRREEKMQATLPNLGVHFDATLPPKQQPGSFSPRPAGSLPREDFREPFARVGTCKHCGRQTGDWVSFDGRTATCVCRDCVGK
ncbi:MAG: competence protein CoiA family protein [Chloroflexota bacterium]